MIRESHTLKDMYQFKELLAEVEFEKNGFIGSLEKVGMFPNVPEDIGGT